MRGLADSTEAVACRAAAGAGYLPSSSPCPASVGTAREAIPEQFRPRVPPTGPASSSTPPSSFLSFPSFLLAPLAVMGIFRPATPGFLVTLIATGLLAAVSFNVPIIKSIYFLKATVKTDSVDESVLFGTLGYCLDVSNNQTCSKPTVGYELGESDQAPYCALATAWYRRKRPPRRQHDPPNPPGGC